jgi:hypothetical protein
VGADAGRRERAAHVITGFEHPRALLVRLVDRHDHHLVLRQPRRADEPVVVAVGHDQRAHEPGGHAPRRIPDVVELARRGLEGDLEGTGEILPQVVAGARLQRLVVLHQGFAAVGPEGAREALAVGLAPGDDRHRHPLLHERAIHAEHPQRLFFGFGLGGMGRVPLLPQELGRPEEEPGAELPAHHVGPLVDQEREVAVALDPLGVHRVDDRFRRRPDDQRLLQLLPAAVRHHGGLGREAFHVLRLAREEALGNEERKVRVLVAGLLEHDVERALHLLPDGVAVGPDDHAAPDRAVVGQLGFHDQLVVPGAEVRGAGREGLVVSHDGAVDGEW